jgi:hypothetical protein
MSKLKSARPLTADEAALLRDVLERRAPELIAMLLPRAEVNALGRDERRGLCEIIAAEFAETGTGADLEPLPRGSRLEDLLDVINRPNLIT